jgi:hypothetical protein
LNPDASLIASWDTGDSLVAELNKIKGRVVTLNFVPVSSKVTLIGWDQNSDGGQLILNALFYVSSKPTPLFGNSKFL